MWRTCGFLFFSVVLGTEAWAQISPGGQSSAPGGMQGDRAGFTILANAGLGFQRDEGLDASGTGLAGINLGIGGFINDRTAIMFRLSGTNVNHEIDDVGDVGQVSGVAGGSVQYWLTPRFSVEGGAGVGFWSVDDVNQQGLGIILAATGVVFMHGKHNITAGVEYAPAFTDSGAVHNLGFVVGYQFVRR